MEIIVYDVEKICRSCLKQPEEMISIFENDSDFGENIKINDIMKTLVTLEVSCFVLILKI